MKLAKICWEIYSLAQYPAGFPYSQQYSIQKIEMYFFFHRGKRGLETGVLQQELDNPLRCNIRDNFFYFREILSKMLYSDIRKLQNRFNQQIRRLIEVSIQKDQLV